MQEGLVLDGVDREAIRSLYEGQRLGFRQVAERLGVPPWRVYRLMREYKIPRRRGSEQNYATYQDKPQFMPRQELTIEQEQLRVAGVMLYRAEGVQSGGTVDFANCDPQLIAVFAAFLREICGVAEQRLRVLLYAYADQDVEDLKMFWSKLTGIPTTQFIKPYVRALTPNTSRRKMLHGLVHIRYNDKRLLQLILDWSTQFSKVWAGT
ncbi:MAG: hypothetical protein COV75_03770 [Candidatus Omnitrophica bacterium CG11_big_fil_rev_8_21_14_0_20_63_9]|nr:MAG: hypothetical protein COV75_03770 [Candidatus Omnitrophica bacterium CG11_big_fil_rev_8_21_14_0_20_63_9]